MKIGIIELATPGHFTLVDSVARIFSYDSENSIQLFLTDYNFQNGENLCNKLERSNILTVPFSDLSQYKNDLIIIITPDQQLKKVQQITKENCWIFIHNIDDWFESSLKKTLSLILNSVFVKLNFLLAWYYLKRFLKETSTRKRIIDNINSNSNSKFIVLNETLKKILAQKVPANKIEIIPFSIYTEKKPIQNIESNSIRICIPGMVSQGRRDYIGFLRALLKTDAQIRKHLVVDLLGGFSNSVAEKSEQVRGLVKILEEKGYNIITRNKSYIQLDEFDIELSKADIILGNLIIDQGAGSSYGGTKESGIPFTMIRMAKPGFLPKGYQTISEITGSTLEYTDYDNLIEQLRSLIIDKSKLSELKEKALLNSALFTDEAIYKKLQL